MTLTRTDYGIPEFPSVGPSPPVAHQLVFGPGMASMVRRFVNLHVPYHPDPARTRRRGGGGTRRRRTRRGLPIGGGHAAWIVPFLRSSSDPGVDETGERLMASEL